INGVPFDAMIERATIGEKQRATRRAACRDYVRRMPAEASRECDFVLGSPGVRIESHHADLRRAAMNARISSMWVRFRNPTLELAGARPRERRFLSVETSMPRKAAVSRSVK